MRYPGTETIEDRLWAGVLPRAEWDALLAKYVAYKQTEVLDTLRTDLVALVKGQVNLVTNRLQWVIASD